MKKRIFALLMSICIVIGLMLQFPVATNAASIDLPQADIDFICDQKIGVDDNGEDIKLQFGMTFTAPGSEDSSEYDEWAVDYELTFNKDIRGKDGFLAGSYQAHNGGDWVVIKLSESDPGYNDTLFYAYDTVRLIKTFSGPLFGANDAELPYGFIRDVVGTFQCGLTLDPDFCEANKDVAVKLALKMYSPEGESYIIGEEYVFTLGATTPHCCSESGWEKGVNAHYKKHCISLGCPFYQADPAQNKFNEKAHTFGADNFCTVCGYLRDTDSETAPPKTGDTTHTLLWTALFLGGMAMMWMQLSDRKREMF